MSLGLKAKNLDLKLAICLMVQGYELKAKRSDVQVRTQFSVCNLKFETQSKLRAQV